MDIRNVKNIDDLIIYFAENLNWNIDLDDFDEIEDITYDFDATDIGLKEEAFAKITSLRQLQPLCDEQKWGIFCVEFDSNKFEVSALRKILSGLIPKRRNATEHTVWAQKDLLFICFWGKDNNRTIGIAHFEDKEAGLPQIKMVSCSPAVEDFTQIKIFEERIGNLAWVRDESDTEAWYAQWSSAFVTAYHQVIRDSASLTVKLAAEAQAIRDRILDIYDVENKEGYVHKLFDDFKDNLIHDMTKQQFADMYAQTVVYGLFSAKCMDKTQDDFDVQEAINSIPKTNPFLKRLMEECLGKNSERHLTFDELEVANVVDILTHTNTDVILKDFNRQTGGGREDPVIHFYEEFLTAYDKAQKIQRGVYYTPQPVVNFIVRAVDDILKTEFGLEDGLASEETKEVKYMRDSMRKNSEGLITQVEDKKEVPAVQILDPATGTGTFLRQTILQIYDNFKSKHKGESEAQIKEAWNEYVPKHLLPRLNGFEIMMAPYSVAHMKLAMVLKDTGYDFNDKQRLNVFLTNSLEEPGNDEYQLTLFENDPLAFESIEANQAKKNNGINVIIGNPPYSGESANKGKWIMNLMDDYKKEPGGRIKLQEQNYKWINDDYVKFIRYAQTFIDKVKFGIMAYICPHGFIDNPTFRGMRWNLLQTYNKVYILNLHGNAKKKETALDGSKDENVFDIQQGVSIVIFIKSNSNDTTQQIVNYYDVYGTRDKKYDFLNNTDIKKINWDLIPLIKPNYSFHYIENPIQDHYLNGISVRELFGLGTLGILSKRDSLVVDFTKNSLINKIEGFADQSIPIESLCELYNLPLKDKDKWDAESARKSLLNCDIEDEIVDILYRPFDNRKILYFDDLIARPNRKVFCHVAKKKNYCLIVCRQGGAANQNYWDTVFITSSISDQNIYRRGGGTVLPLYIYNDQYECRSVNLKEDLAIKLLKSIGIKYTDEMALNLFDYIYAVLHSPKYREKYKEFLKIDFPRVPYPTNQESFWKLVEIGNKLRECHLMHTEFDFSDYTFVGEGTNEVVKPEYKNGRVYISKSQYFDNVPQTQWEQYIGGYQPLQKWLKDRKKTMLSTDDIEHYKKIIAALKLTEELMAEIDTVVEF